MLERNRLLNKSSDYFELIFAGVMAAITGVYVGNRLEENNQKILTTGLAVSLATVISSVVAALIKNYFRPHPQIRTDVDPVDAVLTEILSNDFGVNFEPDDTYRAGSRIERSRTPDEIENVRTLRFASSDEYVALERQDTNHGERVRNTRCIMQ